MVHMTDMKKITLTEQVADDYKNLGKQGRFSKKCIPRDNNTQRPGSIHKANLQQDPTKDTTTTAAPTEIEGPPSSHLDPKQSSS